MNRRALTLAAAAVALTGCTAIPPNYTLPQGRPIGYGPTDFEPGTWRTGTGPRDTAAPQGCRWQIISAGKVVESGRVWPGMRTEVSVGSSTVPTRFATTPGCGWWLAIPEGGHN